MMTDHNYIRLRFPNRYKTAHFFKCLVDDDVIQVERTSLCGRTLPEGTSPAIKDGYECITCHQLWFRSWSKTLDLKKVTGKRYQRQ